MSTVILWSDENTVHVHGAAAYVNTHMRGLHDTLPQWQHHSIRDEEEKNYWISFLNRWCHMDYFTDVLAMFLDLDRVRTLAVYAGSESSRISSKIS